MNNAYIINTNITNKKIYKKKKISKNINFFIKYI